MTDAAKIAKGLTKAQRDMMLLEDGEYQHDSADIIALIAAGVWGTCPGPNYAAVRAELERNSHE